MTTQRNCEQTTHDASPQQNVPPHNIECSQATKCAPTQQSSAETQSENGFQPSKTLKTYLDFKDSLSEREREKFLLFVKKQIKDFARPINDLEAWLASNTNAGRNRWEVYYQIYRERDNNLNSNLPESKKKIIAAFQKQINSQAITRDVA